MNYSKSLLLYQDEPAGNLGSRSSEQIAAILGDLNRQDGITIILVTHEPEIASQAQRVIRMLDGRVTADERRAS
ncbi:hypothetical protein ACFLVX_04810 [Chloroflexota bacterium]